MGANHSSSSFKKIKMKRSQHIASFLRSGTGSSVIGSVSGYGNVSAMVTGTNADSSVKVKISIASTKALGENLDTEIDIHLCDENENSDDICLNDENQHANNIANALLSRPNQECEIFV
jgi:hypothetical protein